MKINILIFFLTLFSLSGFTQNTVKINAICPLIKDGTEITLIKAAPRRFEKSKLKLITKSAYHRFSFVIPTGFGENYLLYVNKNFARLHLGPSDIALEIIDSTLKTLKVTGNKTYDEYEEFNSDQSKSSESKAYDIARVNYYHSFEANNITSKEREILKIKVDSLNILKQKKDLQLSITFINKHPSSYLNTFLLYNLIDRAPEKTISDAFKKLPLQSKKNTWGSELQYRIDSLFIGSKAPAFMQADTAGQMVSLNSFKGKYLLLDFWASWCVPCRADNPNLIKAINNYSNKNFTIASISLDSDKAKWMQAIKDDKLTAWTHLSDLKVWNNEVSSKYYVYAAPNNYLIDPNGIIIAKDIHGEELLNKLNELIK
ncbi:peroxiredoxin family protein [Mucilaginibacter lutimaris]|uniref:Peroxiredoxin family protein n=1 Tax=Mucilaginibacter lutimaris TaxID=931629 RepID=A0ABW2ZJY0_9SPHI